MTAGIIEAPGKNIKTLCQEEILLVPARGNNKSTQETLVCF